MRYILGIDEVGRGPLAGPVTICIVACEQNLYKKLKKDRNLPQSGKDSKKLSPIKRQKYAEYLKYIGILHVIVNVSNKIIDKKGISFAIKNAIEKGLKNLSLKSPSPRVTLGEGDEVVILLDGGLRAPCEYKNQKTIIRGDEKEKIISWASILAKVSRDEIMCKLAKKYPKYGLEINKGYGTKKHIEAIKKYKLSDIHRISFCRNI